MGNRRASAACLAGVKCRVMSAVSRGDWEDWSCRNDCGGNADSFSGNRRARAACLAGVDCRVESVVSRRASSD